MLRQDRLERAVIHALVTLATVVTGSAAGQLAGTLASVVLFGFDGSSRPDGGVTRTLLDPETQGVLAGAALGIVVSHRSWRRVRAKLPRPREARSSRDA